jgi:hypothetical protein
MMTGSPACVALWCLGVDVVLKNPANKSRTLKSLHKNQIDYSELQRRARRHATINVVDFSDVASCH